MDRGENELSNRIIGAAIEVHKVLGPGLLESAYRDCLCVELQIRNIKFEKEREIPVEYKSSIVRGYRADIVVEDLVIIECKAVAKIEPLFASQMLTYLRTSGLHLGLLINFNVLLLKDGIHRIVNGL
ncbi:MAG TPA: GxxExxY protein [Rectinemataceae bacterium]|nr:GxxExxY protein [Rectinemataceae bacterium]